MQQRTRGKRSWLQAAKSQVSETWELEIRSDRMRRWRRRELTAWAARRRRASGPGESLPKGEDGERIFRVSG